MIPKLHLVKQYGEICWILVPKGWAAVAYVLRAWHFGSARGTGLLCGPGRTLFAEEFLAHDAFSIIHDAIPSGLQRTVNASRF